MLAQGTYSERALFPLTGVAARLNLSGRVATGRS